MFHAHGSEGLEGMDVSIASVVSTLVKQVFIIQCENNINCGKEIINHLIVSFRKIDSKHTVECMTDKGV